MKLALSVPNCVGTVLRLLQTISENLPIWRLKHLVTLLRYINKLIYLSIYLSYLKTQTNHLNQVPRSIAIISSVPKM